MCNITIKQIQVIFNVIESKISMDKNIQMLCNFCYIHQPLNYLISFHQIVFNYMKDEKLGMKTLDHFIYKMVINCCAQWKCMKYNKSWHSTTNFIWGKYWE